VGNICYDSHTRPEDRTTLESAPSAVVGADGWAGPNVLPFLKQPVIQRPESDKLQGVWGTESPGITHTKQRKAKKPLLGVWIFRPYAGGRVLLWSRLPRKVSVSVLGRSVENLFEAMKKGDEFFG
jgi:hypothetical protein